ncbi:MAG: helix-turn-helix transcriptional regulator [Weissella confusa]|nr:helix-turn-helix transcriptional regulator [Weissella confusa]
MSVKEARRTLKRAYSDFQFHLDENEVSRKELAEVIGTSEQYVSRLVNGREDSKAAKEKLRKLFEYTGALMLDLRTDFSLPCKLIAEEHFLYDSIFTRI